MANTSQNTLPAIEEVDMLFQETDEDKRKRDIIAYVTNLLDRMDELEDSLEELRLNFPR